MASERAQAVIDRISWLQHCEYVCSLCDSTTTAIVAFGIFKRSASAERGRCAEPTGGEG